VLKAAFFTRGLRRGLHSTFTHGLRGCGKNLFPAYALTSAAKAYAENKLVIAAINRCATQNQVHNRVFPQPLTPWAAL
jgi:hypothetical protein